MGTKIEADGTLTMAKEGFKRKRVERKYWIACGKFEAIKGRMPTEEEKKELREAVGKPIKEGIPILNTETVAGDVIQKESTESNEKNIAYDKNVFETPHFRLVYKSDDTYDIMYLGYNEIIAPEHSVSRNKTLEKLLRVYRDCVKETGSIMHTEGIVVNAIAQLVREEREKEQVIKEFKEDIKEFEEMFGVGQNGD